MLANGVKKLTIHECMLNMSYFAAFRFSKNHEKSDFGTQIVLTTSPLSSTVSFSNVSQNNMQLFNLVLFSFRIIMDFAKIAFLV